MENLFVNYTVESQSTKDKVGFLPLFAYSTPDPPPRLLEFSITDNLASVASGNTKTQRESYNVAILFEISCVLTVKHDCICGVINQGPFFFGIDKVDVSHKQQNIFCDVQLSVQPFEDCVLFTFYGAERIHQDAIAGKVDKGHFERGNNFVKLTEMSYETLLRHQNDVEDLNCQT